MRDERSAPKDGLLSACDQRQIGVAIPIPLSDRIDALVTLVESQGERTTRKEVIASLILNASTQPEYLQQIVREYRRADITSAALKIDAPKARISTQKPGPRARRAKEQSPRKKN